MSTKKVHQVGPFNTTYRGAELTYKNSRVINRDASFVDFCKRKGSEVDTYSNRQYNSFKKAIENGGNSEPEAQIFKQRDMGLSFFLGIIITAEYLPSVINTQACFETRQGKDPSE